VSETGDDSIFAQYLKNEYCQYTAETVNAIRAYLRPYVGNLGFYRFIEYGKIHIQKIWLLKNAEFQNVFYFRVVYHLSSF